jgi:hypothetical protein
MTQVENLSHVFPPGFPPSREEVILFVAFLAGALAVTAMAYLLQNRRDRRERRARARALFERRVDAAALTSEERPGLRRAAAALSSPDAEGLVVSDVAMFNKAMTRLLRRNGISEMLVASIRIKLGFARPNRRRAIRSTVDIPAGTPVSITVEGNSLCNGRVRGGRPHGLVVALDEVVRQLQAGTRVTVSFSTQNGRFHFSSAVIRVSGRIAELAHSETVAREQKRKYLRKHVTAPVLVSVPDEGAIHSSLVDLSGGGATLLEPPAGRPIRVGDHVSLTLVFPDHREPLVVSADVLRTSHDGRHAHVRFGPMRRTVRDRLVEITVE